MLATNTFRQFSSMANNSSKTLAKAIVYSEFGNPRDVLRTATYPVPKCSDSELSVRFLASPINPSDINQIQGVYPSRPPFTYEVSPSKPSAVAGNEGLLEITDVGEKLKKYFSPGQWAVMASTNLGTWRTRTNLTSDQLIPLDKTAFPSIAEAATLTVNPCTAYCLLQKIVPMNRGDWFIQDGANSMVGLAAIQLGKHFGYNSINIIRNRPDVDQLKEQLHSMGATVVLTDEEFMNRAWMKENVGKWTQGGKVKLGFDCVSGRVASEMAKYMTDGATMATYGAMSRQPLPVPVSLLIFKNIHFHGFWVTKWKSEHPQEYEKLVLEIQELIRTGVLRSANSKLIDLHETADGKTFYDTFLNAIEQHGKSIIQFRYD
ncbi:enoyl-[acyl-carrier protein] reductase [Schizosaccharomyces cryophilus OY26]|uniref:enoyl-[acyl-carrier-protein] reductase n=1 Tax=Schizosaccharomyces cryophilus (strain OY26 / ATCC MYA-4695 / CBS 11777 / NBRC 106824 / NRRL Y48691) TaxID=653667 RepID=S9VQH4_SCHCR|nr:enoyl-[acyl-carrier protein] reductase [Schizosaccharomyces cryophilus OY26]EPY50213.1 enoyl-[acyl-carrier protein] reductase [Schizosaccharomyces cryophilus OY26]